MKAKVVITFATCSALSFILCAGAHAQAATEGAIVTGGTATGATAARPRPGMPGIPSTGTAAAAPAATQGENAAIPAASPTTFHDSTNDLYLAAGKTVLVDTQYPITRVATGLGSVAIAHVVTATEVMVDGQAPGQTSLIIWDARGGRQFFNVTVRANQMVDEDKLEAVRRELRLELPGQRVSATMGNGSVFLRGTVNDLTSSQRAAEIAGTAGKVVNLLDVNVPASKPQILLKVRFASIDLNRARSLGINLFNLGLGNSVGGITTGQFSPPTISGGSSSSSGSGSSSGGVGGAGGQARFANELNFLAFFPGLGAGADIQALENKGVVQVLAQPNLVTEDGREANFLAGGQFPYPVVQGGGAGTPATVTIEFKSYGVSLDFLPTITPRNTIRLQVSPQVSALDYTNEVQISGFQVPGITTRSVNTEVELGDGESFLIGGLLDQTTSQIFDKIPFLGDIPILGKFFQSQSTSKNDTELIVIVTPEIVSPIPAGKPLPDLNYPQKFLPPATTTPLHHPDAKTAANTLAPTPATMPVEQLIESMKPEKPLSAQGSGGGGSMGGGMGTGVSTGASSQ